MRWLNQESRWRRAKASTPFNDCVEVGRYAGRVAVRDSKRRHGRFLLFGTADWQAFLDQLRKTF